MAWTGKEYAAMNLRTVVENIHSYASYAFSEIDDTFGEIYDKIENAQNAVEELIKFIEEH